MLISPHNESKNSDSLETKSRSTGRHKYLAFMPNTFGYMCITMDWLHLCMLYGLAPNCMFNCNKETTPTHTQTQAQINNATAAESEKIQKQFSWNFAHSWKTQNSCRKVQQENWKWGKFQCTPNRRRKRVETTRLMVPPWRYPVLLYLLRYV